MLCWENIILPIYYLNYKNLTGNYKVLTNYCRIKVQSNDDLHFIIYDIQNSYIYEPTYEKSRITNDTKKIR